MKLQIIQIHKISGVEATRFFYCLQARSACKLLNYLFFFCNLLKFSKTAGICTVRWLKAGSFASLVLRLRQGLQMCLTVRWQIGFAELIYQVLIYQLFIWVFNNR